MIMRKLLLILAVIIPATLFAQEYDENTIYENVVNANKSQEYIAAKASENAISQTSVTYVVEPVKPRNERKHNFRLGVGSPGLLPIYATKGALKEATEQSGRTMSDGLASYRYYWDDIQYLPFFTLEYSYCAAHWVSVGAKFSALSYYRDRRHFKTDERVMTAHSTTISAMFDVRFTYLNRQYVQLYSGLGLGIRSSFGVERSTGFSYDITWFGLSAGDSVFGFFELGGGYGGVLRAGIGYRF